MMSNKSVLQKANAAIRVGDYEGFLAFCDEDTVWTFVGEKTLRGKEAVRQWMKETYKEPPNFDVANFIAEGDYVTALGTIMLSEAGSEVLHSYCDVWRFRDGKMIELTAFVIKSAEQ